MQPIYCQIYTSPIFEKGCIRDKWNGLFGVQTKMRARLFTSLEFVAAAPHTTIVPGNGENDITMNDDCVCASKHNDFIRFQYVVQFQRSIQRMNMQNCLSQIVR